ncbi:hypothetical protein BCR42DRAFT_406985 [Absidia repens]|uniref:Uncharacterized protein n=1 Tax=Absidia repens TaxID=90262 RepID=A0A1X2IRL4_9FUNG|nr:hypothetical protein BCR42DRAFT_406985 [Absidia repens]
MLPYVVSGRATSQHLLSSTSFKCIFLQQQRQQRWSQPSSQRRHRVTLIQQDFADKVKVKRPLPIVLVQSSNDMDTSWPARWQKKLAEAGYRSSYIRLQREDSTSGEIQSSLDIWYKDLVQAMREHSYFPPLLIGHGEEAWKTSQKYVSNNPVSGLVLIHPSKNDNDDTTAEAAMPSLEFEPHFPLLVVSPANKVPLFLQDEHVDHVDTSATTATNGMDGDDMSLQHTLDWMDDVNM